MHVKGALVLGIPLSHHSPHWNHSENTVVSAQMEVRNMSSKSSSGSWWSALGFGKAAPAPDSDYADMGTAFGLDASLDTLPMPDAADAGKEKGRPPSAGAGPLKRR